MPAGNSDVVISTQALGRSYITYQKQPGFIGSLKGFWQRQHEERIALAPTDLQIGPGQIVGLVGANGAGKTTLLKLLSGLIHPSQGSATVLGYTPWQRNNNYLRQMSVLLGQKNQLWWDISPADSFALLSDIYDLDKRKALGRVQELAQVLDCTHVLKTQLRRLSLGERMKMEIIGALLHEPKVLFLDEPTIGLDIVAQSSIRKFLAQYVADKSPTVILTSHYMDDIARLADRLLLISKGQMVYDGTVEAFTNKTEQLQKIIFNTNEPLPASISVLQHTLQAGLQQFQIEVSSRDLPKALNIITQISGVTDLRLEQVDFEEVVHQFLQHGIR